jgi:hypothetical protein
MAYIKSGTNLSALKRMLCAFGVSLVLLSTLGFAAGELLLNENEVAAKVAKQPDYQLLDARGAAARRSAPLPFSTKYEKDMVLQRGLVFVVADSDAAALEIAQAIPASGDRSVFAVKGGLNAWRRVHTRDSTLTVPSDFVIPKNTCEPAVTVMKMKSNAAIKADKAATETKKK